MLCTKSTVLTSLTSPPPTPPTTRYVPARGRDLGGAGASADPEARTPRSRAPPLGSGRGSSGRRRPDAGMARAATRWIELTLPFAFSEGDLAPLTRVPGLPGILEEDGACWIVFSVSAGLRIRLSPVPVQGDGSKACPRKTKLWSRQKPKPASVFLLEMQRSSFSSLQTYIRHTFFPFLCSDDQAH